MISFEGGGGALPEYASREGCGVRVPDSRNAASRHLGRLGGDSTNQVLNREFASAAAHNTSLFGSARHRACVLRAQVRQLDANEKNVFLRLAWNCILVRQFGLRPGPPFDGSQHASCERKCASWMQTKNVCFCV